MAGVPFKNVIYDYPLGKAMADGFVKEPAVVTRKDFNPAGMSPEEIERLKLEDGIRLHESVKVELETYARQTDNAIVKPFLLVIARDTTHAGQLLQLIQSDGFFEGRYRDKVIQVDSSRTGQRRRGDDRAPPQGGGCRRADGDRHPRQHAQGRLGRDQPLHHRAACARPMPASSSNSPSAGGCAFPTASAPESRP